LFLSLSAILTRKVFQFQEHGRDFATKVYFLNTCRKVNKNNQLEIKSQRKIRCPLNSVGSKIVQNKLRLVTGKERKVFFFFLIIEFNQLFRYFEIEIQKYFFKERPDSLDCFSSQNINIVISKIVSVVSNKLGTLQ
jgi:hypothetical protein